MAFPVHVIHGGKTIGRTVVDEGASTCVMSLSCWKALGSLELVLANTLLTTFDRRYFLPPAILPAFEIKLAWKEVSVEVQVSDAPLDYTISFREKLDLRHVCDCLRCSSSGVFST